MVRFSELMGAGEDPEGEPPKGASETDPRSPAADEPPGSPPAPGPAAPDGPTISLPPETGTPTPASGPATAPATTEGPTADDPRDSPAGAVEKAVNDDLIPRRKRRR